MAFQGDSIFWVEVNKVVPNPYQPRREFDEAKLKELSESIRMYGILQPLTVTRKEVTREDGTFFTEYELIAGERRLRASKLASLEQVPVIIRSGEQTEQEKLELAIIENLQREDLNAVDRALAFQQLADVFGMSHVEVAKKVGRSREYVSNTIRLLMLPEYMLQSLRLGDMGEGHARALLMLKERPEEQDVVFREILLKKLSVREVERIARKIATDKIRNKEWLKKNADLIEVERELTDSLGTRVSIQKTDYGGRLTIDYFSEEDLGKLVAMMKEPIAGAAVDGAAATLATVAAATPLEAATEPASTTVTSEPVSEVTPELAPDDVPEDVSPADVAAAAVVTEEAVSEVIGDMVAESAEYAAVESEERQTPEVAPATNQVTLETSPAPAPAPESDADRYRLEPYVPQWEYVPPTVPTPTPTPVPEQPIAPVSAPATPAAEPVAPVAPDPVEPRQPSEQPPVSPTPPESAIETLPPATPLEAAQPQVDSAPEQKDDSDDDESLYSLRNFSI